ncbi:MAG: hypothetical protein ACLFPA_08460 [Dichotomicrobium sp.]
MAIKLVLAGAVAAATLAATAYGVGARADTYYYDDFNLKHCGALIRSAGKKNLVRVFARNSAVFAWKREARYVYGHDHGYWSEARGSRIECHSEGIFVRCVAKAHPCQR